MEIVKEVNEYKARTRQRASVVMFTAKWCGPCKKIKPEFERMACMHEGIDFFKVDVDEGPEIASLENIQAMPTFKFFMNGKVVKHFTGTDIALLEDNMLYLLSILKTVEN